MPLLGAAGRVAAALTTGIATGRAPDDRVAADRPALMTAQDGLRRVLR